MRRRVSVWAFSGDPIGGKRTNHVINPDPARFLAGITKKSNDKNPD